MTKFKHWLIKKLGGCLPDRKEIQLTKTVVTPIKVTAVHEEFCYAELMRRFPAGYAAQYVQGMLAHEIVEQLMTLGLLEVKQKYDEFTDVTRFTTSITVIPQERSEGK